MSTPGVKDYNESRRRRSESERRFYLFRFTFSRRAEVPLSVLTDFNNLQGQVTDGVDTPQVVRAFSQSFLQLVNPQAIVTATGADISALDAWDEMVNVGDDQGTLGAETLAEVVQDLMSGLTGGPTGGPLGSEVSSLTPLNGTSSTGGSPSPAETSTPSTPAAPVTPST